MGGRRRSSFVCTSCLVVSDCKTSKVHFEHEQEGRPDRENNQKRLTTSTTCIEKKKNSSHRRKEFYELLWGLSSLMSYERGRGGSERVGKFCHDSAPRMAIRQRA